MEKNLFQVFFLNFSPQIEILASARRYPKRQPNYWIDTCGDLSKIELRE